MRWRPLSTRAPEAKARSIGFSIPRIASGIMWRLSFMISTDRPAILAFSLQLAKVFRASLGDLLPTLPSKLDGGGIFLFWQNLEGVASTPALRVARGLSAR